MDMSSRTEPRPLRRATRAFRLPSILLAPALALGGCGAFASTGSADDATSPTSSVAGPAGVEATAGQARPVDPPAASAIEGCTEDSCELADAVEYQHESKGLLTVVLYVDGRESVDPSEKCRIAVLADDQTVQIVPILWGNTFDLTGAELTNAFHFLSPAADATKRLFIKSPVLDGGTADGLIPMANGYFQPLDISELPDADDLDEDSDVRWGPLDDQGYYTLKVNSQTARWNGKAYVLE